MSKIDDIERAVDDLIKAAWNAGWIINRGYASDEHNDMLKAKVEEKKDFLLTIIGANKDMYKITLPDDLFDME